MSDPTAAPNSSTTRNLTLVILLGAVLYLLGNAGISLWDRDEPRYAQTSRQMLQSGDWVVPRYLDKVRTAKPVFIYWCQAASMKLFGDQGNTGVFAARFPSAIAMTLVLVILAVAFRSVAGPERAFWAVFIFATCVLTLWSAKACTTDAVLLVGITVSQICLYQIWRGRGTWPVIIVLAIAIGEAGLTKGPVVLGVMGMTVVALGVFRWIDRRKRGSDDLKSQISDSGSDRGQVSAAGVVLRIVLVTVLVGALVGPWLYLVNQRVAHFLGTSVSHDVLNRMVKPLEGHSGPPGYHLALVFATFFPWSILLPMAVVSGWKNRHDPLLRFCLAAVVGPWLMFEVIRTKLPHYLLPVFPPLALLTADAIVRCLRGEKNDLRQKSFLIAAGVIGFVVIALGVATIYGAVRFEESMWPALLLALAGIGFAAAVLRSFLRGRERQGLLAMGFGVAVVYVMLFGVYLPRAQFLHLSKRAADVLHKAGATGEGQSEMLDYKEPSLAFYQGGTIRENSAVVLSHDILDRSPPWLVVTNDVLKKTPDDVKARVEIVGSVRGLAYADGGRVLDVIVVRKRDR